jgi:GNAT superfamily N-acetyltransferase
MAAWASAGIPERHRAASEAVMTHSKFPVVREAAGGRYEIDTDKARLDLAVIHRFLAHSHWARGIPLPVLERAVRRSLAFGLYRANRQVGFARVVTDHATFAYLADVFVLPEERGKGLGRWLVETILGYSRLQGLRRWLLGTRDAQALYERCGFRAPAPPFAFLERLDAKVYEPVSGERRRPEGPRTARRKAAPESKLVPVF